MTRTVPAALALRLATGVSTLAHCFVVTRADGQVFGFTSHDRPLTVEGVVCSPETGFDATTYDATLGGATDGMDVAGVLDDDRITRDDIERGIWDGSQVRALVVDWTAPADTVLLAVQTIAEITVSGASLVAQLRSQMSALADERGRLLEHDCGWQLGDEDCAVDLGALAVAATLTAVGDDWVEAAEAAAEDDGHFDLGAVTLAGGEAAQVLNHTGTRLTFFAPPAVAPAAGDAVTLRPGCDHSWGTCKAKFDNAANYGGFPFMLGADALMQTGAYPGREGGVSQLRSEPPDPPAGLAIVSQSDNSATIGFDPAPVYVENRGAGSSARVYGMDGRIFVSGLPWDATSTVELVAVIGELESGPATIDVTVGSNPGGNSE